MVSTDAINMIVRIELVIFLNADFTIQYTNTNFNKFSSKKCDSEHNPIMILSLAYLRREFK